MKKFIPMLIAIVLIIVIGAVTLGGILIEKYSYSDERADLNAYFSLETEEEAAIILQDTMIEEKAIVSEGRCYFDFATVQNYLNDRFYKDTVEGLILYTTPTEVIRTTIGSNSYSINGVETDAGYPLTFIRTVSGSEVCYLAADFVQMYTNYAYQLYTEPYHIQMTTEWKEYTSAEIKKDVAVRERGGIKSSILTDVTEGAQVTVLEQMDTWSKVKTADSYIGYVENKFLDHIAQAIPDTAMIYEEPEYTSLTKDTRISLGWHAVASVAGNDTFSAVAANTSGLTVIAPTWFSLNDNEGNFQNFATASYVTQAHNRNMEVWGVVDDFNYKNNTGADVDVLKVLSSTTTRTYLIDGLMKAASDCGMDGINLDFENISVDSGEHFIQFVRELSIRCREAGLVLSIDNYVPFNFNSFYDLEEQGLVADYVVIMGYDEHWSGSQEAGSVASLDYVRSGLDKTTEVVPSKKVINALPFYTRLWITSGTSVSSEAYPLTSVDGVLARYGMEKKWDETTSQNYGEATINETLYQIWIEDSESLLAKLNVMQMYDLGGVAAWRLGYESSDIWSLINAYLGQ